MNPTTDSGIEDKAHRTPLADCGNSYAIGRGLRAGLDVAHRESIVELLVAVA